VFKHLPLSIHPSAIQAAEASVCANQQNKFWAMHDRLFENQEMLDPVQLRRHSDFVGLDLATFDGCAKGHTATTVVTQQASEAKALGFSRTPTFLIGELTASTVWPKHVLVGAKTLTDFTELLDRLLAR
jgi:protein-disulfide isomerase